MTPPAGAGKLVVVNLMSLDGYVAGDGGNLMVLPLDESFSAYNVERLREAGTLLLGATTYRGFLGYWPAVEDDVSQPPVEREISSINNRIAKVVVSDSMTPADTGPWRDGTEIVGRGEPAFRASFGGQAFDGSLTLTGLRQLEGSQNVLLTYAVAAG